MGVEAAAMRREEQVEGGLGVVETVDGDHRRAVVAGGTQVGVAGADGVTAGEGGLGDALDTLGQGLPLGDPADIVAVLDGPDDRHGLADVARSVVDVAEQRSCFEFEGRFLEIVVGHHRLLLGSGFGWSGDAAWRRHSSSIRASSSRFPEKGSPSSS